jgi:hypothetical protein
MRARQFWLAPFWNAEGGGAGAAGGGGAPAGGGNPGASGGGGGAAPDLVRAAAENPPPGGQQSSGQTPPGGGSAAAYWPEGLPETFAGFKGANDRETIDKLSGHLRDQPHAPEKPDGYKLQLSPDFVKRYGDLANDEVVPIWRQIAHKNGLTETQFNGAISELYSELSSKGLIDEPIDVGAEFEKLMPKHGDPVSRKAQASARINGVANTITGLVNRQILSKAEGNMVLSLAARSEGVIALEKLFKTLGEHGLQGGGEPGGQQQSEHERAIRAMFPSMHKAS